MVYWGLYVIYPIMGTPTCQAVVYNVMEFGIEVFLMVQLRTDSETVPIKAFRAMSTLVMISSAGHQNNDAMTGADYDSKNRANGRKKRRTSNKNCDELRYCSQHATSWFQET